jgi:hypothetical protein
MPHTKSKAQTRARGTVIPSRKTTRDVDSGRVARGARRKSRRELPLRAGSNVPAHDRRQAEKDYAGDTGREFALARSKRLGQSRSDARPEASRALARSYVTQRKARDEGRRPTKVAASTRKPRSK